MIVKEAKEIIATMDLSNKTLDKALALLKGLTDDSELAEVILDQLLALIDKESGILEEEISVDEVMALVDEKNNPIVKT